MGFFSAIGKALGKANQLAEEYQLARNYGTNWRDLVSNAQNQLALQFAMLQEDRQDKFDERASRREQREMAAEERRLAREARERAEAAGLAERFLRMGQNAVVVGPKGEVSLDRAALPTVALPPEQIASLEANLLARGRQSYAEHARSREERAADLAASQAATLAASAAGRKAAHDEWLAQQEWLRNNPPPERPPQAEPLTARDVIRLAIEGGPPDSSKESPEAFEGRARRFLALGQSLGGQPGGGISEPPPDEMVTLPDGRTVPYALIPEGPLKAAARAGYRPSPGPGLILGAGLSGR